MRGPGGRFARGNRVGAAGRPKGSKDVRALIGAELIRSLLEGDGRQLAPIGERLTRLLTDRSAVVRLKAETLLLGYAYGTRHGHGLLDDAPVTAGADVNFFWHDGTPDLEEP